MSRPSVCRSHGRSPLSLVFSFLGVDSACREHLFLPCPGLGTSSLHPRPGQRITHTRSPRSPAGDTPSQGPGQPPLLALGQLQSPMTLQTNEQVEASSSQHHVAWGGRTHTHVGKDGTGQQCKSALLEAQCSPHTEAAGGLAAVVALSTHYWPHGAGGAVWEHMAPGGRTLPCPGMERLWPQAGWRGPQELRLH